MRRALLMPDQDMLDLLLLEQLVVNVENRTTWIAEDVFDAFFLEAADDDLCARELHGFPASSRNNTFARRRSRGSGSAKRAAPRSGAHFKARVESRDYCSI